MSTWDEILKNPEFQNEPLEKKVAIRDSYFNNEIRPNVEAANDDVEAVRASFNEHNDFGAEAPQKAPQATPRVNPADVPLTNIDRVLNRVGGAMSQLGSLSASILPTTNVEGLNALTNPVKEAPIQIGDDVDWEVVKRSEDFLSQSPYEKRRIAEAFYNKHVEPNVPVEQKDEVRKDFYVSSGLPEVDSSGIAVEQKGALAKTKDVVVAGADWAINSDNRVDDVSNFLTKVKQGASEIKLSEVPAQLWDSLKEMGSSIQDYVEEANSGMTDEEFKKQYFVPESETGNALSTLDRLKYKQEFMSRERNAILGGNTLDEVSSVGVREQAEREGATSRLSNAVDVASMVPGLQGMKGASLLQKVGSLAANTTKATAATGVGEVVKNVAEGREASQGVGEAMVLDTLLNVGGEAVAGAMRAPTARSNAAAKSVKEGNEEFDYAIKKADDTQRLSTEAGSALKGKTTEGYAFEDLNLLDPTFGQRMVDVNAAGKASGDALEKAYKTNITFDLFRSRANKAGVKGLSEQQLSDWFNLRRGEYDTVITLAKEAGNKFNKELLDSPLINNYLRSTELNELGVMGRMVADVSDTAGASAISKGLSTVDDFFGAGLGGGISRMATSSADKRLVKEAQRGLSEGYDKLLQDVNNTSSEIKQGKDFIEESVSLVQESKSFVESITKEIAGLKKDKSIAKKKATETNENVSDLETQVKDAQTKLDEIENKAMESGSDADWANVEATEVYVQQLKEKLEEAKVKSKPDTTALDEAIRIAESKKALGVEELEVNKANLRGAQSIAEQIKVMETDRKIKTDSMSALESRLDKKAFTEADVVATAPAVKAIEKDWLSVVSKESDYSAREGLQGAIAALTSRGKGGKKSMSGAESIGRVALGAAIINFVGAPVAMAKAGLSIANFAAQASQKRGLVKGVRAMNEHVSAVNKLKAKGEYTNAAAAKLDAELDKKLKAEGMMAKAAPLARLLEESLRMAERMEDEE